MASIYRHLTGDSDKGSAEYKIIGQRSAKIATHNITLFLVSNTCAQDLSIDVFLRKVIRTITQTDAEGRPMDGNDISETYYVLKNISIPAGSSYNIIEGLGKFEYRPYFAIYVNVTGDDTKTLDLILNYE